jgi:hypothetical protein
MVFRRRTESPRNEILSHAAEFPPTIHEAGFGLDPKRVTKFRKAFCETPEDTGLFEKIWENMRVIDEHDFDAGIRDIEATVGRWVGDAPYYLVTDRFVGKSGGFVVGKLNLERHSPIDIVECIQGAVPQVEFGSDIKVVIADDAGYSGARFLSMANAVHNNWNTSKEDILVASVGMTRCAIETLESRNFSNIYCAYKIPTVVEILTEEEQQLLRRKSNWSGSYKQAVLTFLYYKVPDNFLGGFKKSIPIDEDADGSPIYLIDDTKSGIYPPYKRR